MTIIVRYLSFIKENYNKGAKKKLKKHHITFSHKSVDLRMPKETPVV